MKKFVVETGAFLGSPIRAEEVERETRGHVWVNGTRRSKNGIWGVYFDTWQEAHSFMVERSRARVGELRALLDASEKDLQKVLAMVE